MEPADFAYAPAEWPPASDLVDGATWHSIMTCPSSASIQTSNYLGSTVRQLNDLWGAWIMATPLERGSPWALPMLDISDELQGATFAWLHGYYRLALAALRSALEIAVVAAAILGDPPLFRSWQDGKLEIGFAVARRRLLPLAKTAIGNSSAAEQMFGEGGWATKQYSALCRFSHTRPRHTSATLWDYSNGPFYNESGSRYVAKMWNFACATCWLALSIKVAVLSPPRALGQLMRSFDRAGGPPHNAWRLLDAHRVECRRV